jgi:deoxyribodipyrimidine photo-lyase
MRPLVWLRADLRLRDNRALHAACERADGDVLAVFTLCPAQWRVHGWGAPKAGFVLRGLAALAEALAERGIPLRLVRRDRFDEVPAALLALARRHHRDALFFNREYEVNERRRDRAVRAAFEQDGRAVHAFDDQTILPPADVRTGQGGFYTVFTPYRRRWIDAWRSGDRTPPLPLPRRTGEATAASEGIPTCLRELTGPDHADLWPGGEEQARRRLATFTRQAILDYRRHRDLPSLDGTSALSAHLAAGTLSPRQCLHAALKANDHRIADGRTGPVTWITELLWREFYRHVLVGFPRVCKNRAFRTETEKVPWRHDPESLDAWKEGRTGYPIVDAAMRQLATTGWMHNRLRMIVASFLTKDLLIDWREGEAWFTDQLVDADLASNNGGWQWAASTGTDSQPYFRIFNPTTQSKRYDPDGTFLRAHLPELAPLGPKHIHDPSADQRRELGYPTPIVDHSTARLRAIAAFKNIK